jgi:hypothetical protein
MPADDYIILILRLRDKRPTANHRPAGLYCIYLILPQCTTHPPTATYGGDREREKSIVLRDTNLTAYGKKPSSVPDVSDLLAHHDQRFATWECSHCTK